MTNVVPALSEDTLYSVRSNQLQLLGLRKGDLISIVPLEFYAVGDIVVALVEGFYLIGRLRQSADSLELVTPTQKVQKVSRISQHSIAGFVQKERQEVIAD